MINSRLLGPNSGRAADCFVSSRDGGHSKPPFDQLNLSWQVGDDPAAVAANRTDLARRIGVEPMELFALRAAHGGQVAVIGPPELGHRRELASSSRGRPEPCWDHAGVDALVTTVPGVALVALAADCATVALADPDVGVVAALHCGWKGLGEGIAFNTLVTMRGLGANAIQAVVGPTICPACYGVDADRAREVQQGCSTAVGRVAVRRTVDGGWSVDIGAGLAAQLQTQCASVQRILRCPVCDCRGADRFPEPSRTPSQLPRYFSHRRDGRTGRHGMAVVLRPVVSAMPPLPGTISQ